MKEIIQICENKIGKGQPVFIIAEAGVNHNNDLTIAKEMIDLACEYKANAVKFQTFRADRLVSSETPKVKYQLINTNEAESHYEMIKKLELSEKMHTELINYCKEKSIIFISTPYSYEDAKYLNDIGVEIFKTASSDLVDLQMHEFIASTGKPVIVATGMSPLGEVEQTINIYRKYNHDQVVLLHATSNYPSQNVNLNIRSMTTLQNSFGCIVGYSDHSLGYTAAIASCALGASIIEKHFTLNRGMEGPDHQSSCEPGELKELIEKIRECEVILGDPWKKVTDEEQDIRKINRKSFVAATDISSGDEFNWSTLRLKRPCSGILPYQKDELFGRKANRDIFKDTVIKFSDIEN